MCNVEHVQIKSVFTFQPIKRPVSTTVKSAKPVATFWIFFLRTKNQHLCFLVVMVHIVLQERRVATMKKKSHLHFWRNFSANHIRTWTKKGRSYSIYGIIVSTAHWFIQSTKTSITFSVYTPSVYINATWFSQPPTTVLSGLLTLDQIQWLLL